MGRKGEEKGFFAERNCAFPGPCPCTQLYLAIGIPAGLFALNFIEILWQARGIERRFDAVNIRFDVLEKIMKAKFDAQTQGILRVEQGLDASLKHLEER